MSDHNNSDFLFGDDDGFLVKPLLNCDGVDFFIPADAPTLQGGTPERPFKYTIIDGKSFCAFIGTVPTRATLKRRGCISTRFPTRRLSSQASTTRCSPP